jgi:hypothetical protein
MLIRHAGLSASAIKSHVEREAARQKDSSRQHTYDDDDPNESPHGFIIQALRIEALQYVLLT